MRVVSVEEMREIERRAETEYSLTSPMLMERAGQSVAEILRRTRAAMCATWTCSCSSALAITAAMAA